MKGTVKVAYWDTAQGNPPRLIGEIRGTPTVKFIRPAKKNKRDSNKKKTILDYNGERKMEAMMSYVESQQPSYIVRINGAKDLAGFIEKADSYLLPKVILVTRESSTTSIAKALSTEFRRRLLIGEVKATKNNKEVMDKYGITDFGDEKTVVVVVQGVGDEAKHTIMSKDGKPSKFSLRGAQAYLSKVALDTPYFENPAYLAKQAAESAPAADDADDAEPAAGDKIKSEL